MKLNNFLPLNRNIREHWIYKDNDYFKIWIEMLFSAWFHEESKTDAWKGTVYTLNYGEFLFSRTSYSQKHKITERRLRTLIKLLEDDSMIKRVGSLGKNRPTIIKIVNFNRYNKRSNIDSNMLDQRPSEHTDITAIQSCCDQPMTNERPTNDQRTTTNKNYKNYKNKNNIREIENFRQKYSTNQLVIIDQYLEILFTTRVSGKILDNVIKKVYKEMARHPNIVVEYACMTIIKNPNLHSKKENYFYGIMRNTKADEAFNKLTHSPKQQKEHNNPYEHLKEYR